MKWGSAKGGRSYYTGRRKGASSADGSDRAAYHLDQARLRIRVRIAGRAAPRRPPRSIDNRRVDTHFTDTVIDCIRNPFPRRRNHPVGRPAHPLRIEKRGGSTWQQTWFFSWRSHRTCQRSTSIIVVEAPNQRPYRRIGRALIRGAFGTS